MGHDHHHSSHSHSHAHHSHEHGPHRDSTKPLLGAFVLNLSFTLIEIVGSVLTGSVAILADAAHDLGDTLSLGFGLWLERYSKKAADREFSYGYRRFSLLSALVSGAAMLVAAVFVFIEVVHRFSAATPRVPDAKGMLVLAVLGVAFNGYAFFKMGKARTQNEKMLRWHLFEDAAGWVAVLLGAFIISLTGWVWVDPALALGIGAYVFYNVVKNLRQTARLFLQARPDDFNESEFRRRLMELPGIEGIHDLHVWSLDGHQNILSLHLVLSREAFSLASHVKRKVAEIAHLQSASGAHYHLTIETEIKDEDCRESC